MGLARLPQGDFSAGMFRGDRRLIPANGAYDLLNVLLDSDGDLYRRGGVENLSTADFTALGLTFVWDGRLLGGHRTLIGGPGGFGSINGDGTVEALGNMLPRPVRGTSVGGILFLDGGLIYGGATKPFYNAGTVQVTKGSKRVVGSGTTWQTDVDAGAIFRVEGDDRFYAVESVFDATSLSLSEPYEGTTGSGEIYTLRPVAYAPIQAPIYASVGKRLLIIDGDSVRFSEWDQPQTFLDANEHKIPGGVAALGGASIGATALIFTTDGLWTISNMDLEPLDDFGNLQHQLSHVNPNLVLWSKEGIAAFGDSLVVPATDGIYLIGAAGENQRLDRSIAPLYLDYIRRGYRTGLGAVYRNHYFLPILSSNNRVADVLVCRMDRPIKTSIGVVFPWTRLRGDGANVRSYAVRYGTRPQLLGASGKTSSRLLDCSRYFEPDSDVADDLGVSFEWQIITRDYPTGQGNQNLTRRVDLQYQMKPDQGGNPQIHGAYSTGAMVETTVWGGFDWGGADWANVQEDQFTDFNDETAPQNIDGTSAKIWMIEDPPRSRYLRCRFRTSDPVATLRVSGIVLWTRQSTKAD